MATHAGTAAAGTRATAPAGQRRRLIDHSTLSNFQDAAVTHSDIELDVDFESRVLSGHVEHTVAVLQEGVAELALDTSCDLHISSVTVDGTAAPFRLEEPQGELGRRLSIALPPGSQAGTQLRVGLAYAASPQASAVQWLGPEQTAGKQHPYVFTQCQAIHARSILPCQDAPAAKFTFTAAVRVPRALRALMSAVAAEDDGEEEGRSSASGDGTLEHVSPRAKPGTRVY